MWAGVRRRYAVIWYHPTMWLFVALCDSSSNLPELHTLWGNSKLECWNMALNSMEPLVKTAIGRQELPFPAFF